jgi:hypothetical protein
MNKILIYGGLGNQMFQYALKVAINQKGNKSEILFSNFFYNNHHNGFNIGRAFKLKLPFPLNFYNFLLLNGEFIYKNKLSSFLLEKIISQYHKKKYSSLYNEKKEFIYDKNVFQQTDSLLIGIWQVELYFKNIREKINTEFVFKIPKDKKNKKLIDEIQSCNSVSIHIRRGDYLTAEWAKSHAVIKDKTYYINSINFINKTIENPHYYIFSDDIQWVKDNLKFSNCTFVEHNKNHKAYIDMYLMSLCKHNIIANSTFSWWGAWLNKNENKVIIIPERWLNSDACPGIFPEDWIKIEV